MRAGRFQVLLAACLLAAPAAFAQQYKAPRNGYGQPDFSGAWTKQTMTPFERPPQYGERLVMTEEEVAKLETGADARWAEANAPTDPKTGASTDRNVGGYNAYWVGNVNKVMRVGGEPRTSLITTTRNGRVPPRRQDA